MFLYRDVCRRVTCAVLKETTITSSYARCSKISFKRKLFTSSRCGCSARSRTNVNDQESSGSGSDFVSVSQVKQKLLKNNHIFEDGHCCLSVDCVICKSPSKLYINKVTGFSICYGCGRAGSWQQVEHILANPSAVGESRLEQEEGMEKGSAAWEKISKHLRPVRDLSDVERISITQKLDFKSLPWSVLERKGVMLDDKNNDLYWPLGVPGNEAVVSGYKTICSDLSEQCYPHLSAAGVVLLTPGEDRAKTAVLVPTLRDSLALLLQDIKGVDVICLPHGQFSLPQTVLPILEEYEKLILWFDDDVTSWNNARLFARKLAIDRCHLVRPIQEAKSAFVAYKNKVDIAETLRNAQAMSHASIITFADLRDDLLSELYCSDQATGIKWQRFPALNSILQGHRRGELTILTGPTGSGKTTFMSEYSLDLAMQKVTTLWGSFEIRNQRLVRTMLQQMAAVPLQEHREQFDEWADKFTLLPLYFMTFHGQQALDVVMDTVKHAAYVHDVAHVIIDNVQFMLGLSSGESGFLDRFYRQDALIGAFRNFATTYNCHVTLVIHPRKERDGESLTTSSIFGGAKASQEADNVLIIQHKFTHSGLKMKKYLQEELKDAIRVEIVAVERATLERVFGNFQKRLQQCIANEGSHLTDVAKNRFSGDLGIIPLEFDRESLSFGAKEVS